MIPPVPFNKIRKRKWDIQKSFDLTKENSRKISPLSHKVVDLIKHLKKTKERYIENYAIFFFKKKKNKQTKPGKLFTEENVIRGMCLGGKIPVV